MREWPILFTGEMIRAIRAGLKTQTRRLGGIWDRVNPGDRLWVRETWTLARPATMDGKYVETWEQWVDRIPRASPATAGPRSWVVLYQADHWQDHDFCAGLKWRPSIFLPRWASRELLEVVSNRDEPLQEISEEDARAEGVVLHTQTGSLVLAGRPWATEYRALWDSINGHRVPWASNPRPQVVTFRRVAV